MRLLEEDPDAIQIFGLGEFNWTDKNAVPFAWIMGKLKFGQPGSTHSHLLIANLPAKVYRDIDKQKIDESTIVKYPGRVWEFRPPAQISGREVEALVSVWVDKDYEGWEKPPGFEPTNTNVLGFVRELDEVAPIVKEVTSRLGINLEDTIINLENETKFATDWFPSIEKVTSFADFYNQQKAS